MPDVFTAFLNKDDDDDDDDDPFHMWGPPAGGRGGGLHELLSFREVVLKTWKAFIVYTIIL